jgi:hypothetical protein
LLQLHVGLLLDSLRVLKLLDKLHLKQFHLNYLLLLVGNQSLLLLDLTLDLHPRLLHASATRLIDLLFRNLLLHFNLFLAHVILLCEELHVLMMAHLVLLGLHLTFVSLFLSVHVNGCLDLLLLLLTVLALSCVGLNQCLLLVLIDLHPLNFLLDSLGVALFQTRYLSRAFLGLLDFLPGSHLFLLEEGNTVGKELGVALNAI